MMWVHAHIAPYLPTYLLRCICAYSAGYDALLVLEHAPVYTLGRSAKATDVRFPLDGVDDPGASATRGFDVRVYVCRSS